MHRYSNLTRIRQLDPIHYGSETVPPQIFLTARSGCPTCAACLIATTTASSNLGDARGCGGDSGVSRIRRPVDLVWIRDALQLTRPLMAGEHDNRPA